MTKSEMFDVASQELAKLQAENARLRAALREIHDYAMTTNDRAAWIASTAASALANTFEQRGTT